MMSPRYLWCLATELAGAVNAVLGPFMTEMREGLAAVKTDLRNIDEKVNSLTREFDAHTNQTSLDISTLQSTLDESVTPATEKIASKLASVKSVQSTMKEDVKSVKSQLKKHKNFVADELETVLNNQHSMDLKLDILDLKQDRQDSRISVTHSDLELRILENVTSELARVANSESQLESVNAGIRSELARMSQFIVERGSQLVLDSQDLVINKLDHVRNGVSELVSGIKGELGNISRSVDVCVAGVGESKAMTDQENCTGQDVGSGSGSGLIEGYKCGGTFGWRRVVYLNMTDPTTNCLSGWRLVTFSSKRLCGRVSSDWLTCDSVLFPVTGGDYTSVCGSIRAYQYGPTDAFEPYHIGEATTIDSAYASGVSLTHGSPRQHIWTFAAGYSEIEPTRVDACPCDATIDITIPPFVGGDYFCESGVNSGTPHGFHPDDPLWGGSGLPAVAVAHSTILHTLLSNSLTLPLMILRPDYVD